jgi:hypothetical protein
MISNTPLKTSRLNSFSSPQVVDKVTLGLEVLNVSTVGQDLVVGLEGLVVGSVERSETPLLGDDDSLLTRELVSSSSQSFHDDGLVGVLASDGQDDLTDVDSGDLTVRLTPSTSHTLLQPIGTGTRQHLVDSDDVEGVGSDPQVEGVLS